MNEHSRKTVSSYLVGLLTVLLVAVGIWAAYSYMRSMQYRRQLQTTYLKAMDEASTNIANISSDLVKGLYSGTPTQMSVVSSKLWKESSAAKAALSSLPVSQLSLDNTYRFLSQVGDYAMYLSKKSVSNQRITPEERQWFLSLREYADRLGSQVNQLQSSLASGELTLERLSAERSERMSRELEGNRLSSSGSSQHPGSATGGQAVTANVTATSPAPSQSENGPVGSGSGNDSFDAMEKGFTGYPSLIYDGPFSDHILDKKPTMIQGRQPVSREDALAKAAKAARTDPANLPNQRDEDSSLPSYVFYSDGLSVSVTKNGGFVSYLIKPKPDQIRQLLSKDEAVAAGQRYLAELGIPDMRETYYEITDGLMTINFAHCDPQRQVICYTDLIKVEVSMENGEILGFDARGYLVNHKARSFEEPKLSQEEAQQSLSENLTVESVKLALIPTDGHNEVYAYEFLCTGSTGDKVLVYVNAGNGVEEQILILIQSENGTLTK